MQELWGKVFSCDWGRLLDYAENLEGEEVLNIFLIQEAGRHAANREFREALSMQRALKTLGHEAIVWGLGHELYSRPFDTMTPLCDVIVLLEQYDQTGWVPDFSWFKGPRVFWTIDSHCSLSEHVAQAQRQKVTHLLSSTRRYLDYYNAPNKVWFPNCYDDTLIYPMPEFPKLAPVGFCGNDNGRGQWLDVIDMSFGTPNFVGHSLVGRFCKRDIFVIGQAMVKAVNSYRIHFNRNIADDLNYRTFETLGCQTFLLTNYTDGLDELFEVGRELVTYAGPDDLLAKVRYYLENTGEREAIAEAGFKRVKRDHTYLARAHQLVKILEAA